METEGQRERGFTELEWAAAAMVDLFAAGL